MDQAHNRTIATTIEQFQFWEFNGWVLIDIWRTITLQSFFVLAPLVLELAGGQNDSPQALTFQKHLRFQVL